ncbi:MAG: phosphotransferase family protein [Acidimicrobiales bacterium]|nr:phosphotransferase family protein [Acidimicrobiales bacterium]
MAPTNDELAAALAAVLGGAAGVPVAVRDLQRLSGGASRETFSFDTVAPVPVGAAAPVVEQRILQRERRGSVGGAPAGLEAEARLLRAAARAGVPVPPVVLAGDDPQPLGGRFLVTGRLAGETIPRRLLRDASWATARSRLVADAAAALAAIHRIPLSAAEGYPAPDPVGQLRDLLDLFGQPHPAFEVALRWLDQHRPPSTRRTVVHGDFRLGNLLVGPEGLVAVLDWELAHVGDPMEDLGWLCTRAWRFGAGAPVAGLGTYEELFAGYESAGGGPVDPAAVRWWEVLGTLRWGVICIVQASGHLSGASRSVELAAIGRRVCETEYDLWLLLGRDDPRPEPLPAGVDPAPDVHDAPSAAQLVEAVREFLAGEVLGATEGRVQFHARVAGNVLAMVERELLAGPAQAHAHRQRLAGLGLDSDAALAEALRTGRLASDDPGVRSVIWAAVLDKLRVANPGYADPGDLDG